MRLYFSICFLLFQSALSAQTITGFVLEPGGAPAGFAAVQLRRLPDSSFVDGTSAGADGRFELRASAPGTYFIQAGLIGFADGFSGGITLEESPLDVQAISLGAAGASLREITVRASKPLIERQLDKIVLNIEGSALASGNSAFELLQRSPGVVITPQDAILLNGKGGTLVTIDGRPTQLSGADLVNFLHATPAETIAAIELIATPSSKYDAEGVSGIINIRLKKNRAAGWNGSLTGSYGQALHHRAQGGLNLNYRPGAVNFFGNFNATNAAQLVDQHIERFVGDQIFAQNNPEISNWRSQQIKTGADWSADERNSFGLLVLGSRYDHYTHGNSLTDIREMNHLLPDSSLLTTRYNPEHNRRWNYNFNYRYADTLGTEWTFDADRITFRQWAQNDLNNTPSNTNGPATNTDRQKTDMSGRITIWALKTDLVKTLARGFKLETGLKSSWSFTNHALQTVASAGDGFEPDPGRSNRFDFQENIAAAYANFGRQGDRWGWQIGLRTERTRVRGVSTDFYGTAEHRPDTAYWGWFPTTFFNYKINGNNQLGLSFNRRLERPAYQDLNPFVWYSSLYTSERGNPYLRPAYSHNAELSYTYKYASSISLGYSRTGNVISSVARQTGVEVFIQPENLAQQDQISLNINTPLPIAAWWEGYVWLGIWRSRFRADLPEGRLDAASWGGGCWVSQQFNLPLSFRIEASGWAQFPTREGMFSNRGIWSANLGVKKKLLHERLTLKLAWSDVFNSQTWRQKVDFGAIRGTSRNDWESQNITLGFTWNFGSGKDPARERKIGAEPENGRIK